MEQWSNTPMYLYKIILVILVIVISLNITGVSAQNFEDFSGLKNTAGAAGAGYDTAKVNLMGTIGTVIQYVLSFAGVIMICVILIGYFILSSAGGDEEKVKKAKGWIKNGIVGVLIVFAAYLFTAVFIYFFAQGIFNPEGLGEK